MKFYVYILQSCVRKWYYIGQTNDIKDRIVRHNAGRVKSTKPYKPYRIVFSKAFETRKEALREENRIKSMKHWEAFKKLIEI